MDPVVTRVNYIQCGVVKIRLQSCMLGSRNSSRKSVPSHQLLAVRGKVLNKTCSKVAYIADIFTYLNNRNVNMQSKII